MDEKPKLVTPGTAPGNQWHVSGSHANLVRVAAQPRPIAVSTDSRIVTFDRARGQAHAVTHTARMASCQSSE